MYQVGFGDCFLISFAYDAPLADGRRERHILIDFGSTRWPKNYAPRYREIANDIALQTRRQARRARNHPPPQRPPRRLRRRQAAATIATLKPRLVLRPWTENPPAAATPPARHRRQALARTTRRASTTAQAFAGEVAARARGQRQGFRGRTRRDAIDQLANEDAIDTSTHARRQTQAPGRATCSPGNPQASTRSSPASQPRCSARRRSTNGQPSPAKRADDPEYWLRQHSLLAGMLQTVDAPPAVIRVANTTDRRQTIDPGPLRWIVERMRDQQTHSLLRIVSSLEDALNNTSVILQFQTGTRRMLFPGDAQIENWSYCPPPPKPSLCGRTSPTSTSTRSDTTAAATPAPAASSNVAAPRPTVRLHDVDPPPRPRQDRGNGRPTGRRSSTHSRRSGRSSGRTT